MLQKWNLIGCNFLGLGFFFLSFFYFGDWLFHSVWDFFFLILLWSCIIQIAMCFSEVEDLIFSCDCLPSGRHCEKHFTCKIAIYPLNILKRSVLILSSIFYRWEPGALSLAPPPPSHPTPARAFTQRWNLIPEPFLELLCWCPVIWKG